jgi:ubiquitin C-terminal hydrolase
MSQAEDWSDTNRFKQTGYSSPTGFPQAHRYENLNWFLKDMHKAVHREKSRREWLEEEQAEYRMEEAMERAERRAEAEEWS